MSLTGTILNDRYRLDEPVGEGGMAIVYRAVDTRLGRTVAIKVLHTQFARDEPFLQRFQQEAEFAASLGAHPNIVDIYDIGQDGDLHYIVMEFVEGRSLKELIADDAPFAVPEAFALGWQVASALGFAHSRGLVHRDVKPQNILVTPERVAKVTDFGIARSASASQLTRTGMVIGTVHYFSPEQAQGKPATPASDIYALGVILYEMLTGHLPFDAENPIGVAMQHVHSQPPSPWDYNPDLPARAVATVMRALEKDPERRYRDANEFASALSEQAAPDTGDTTFYGPLVSGPRPRQHTAVYEPVPPLIERVERAPAEAPARPIARRELPQSSGRNWWLPALLALLILGVGLGSFLVTGHILGASGTPPTSTPTVTPKPTAKPKKPKPTATVNVPVIVPTVPPTAVPPPPATPTPTPKPPPPTVPPTPRPKPTATLAPPPTVAAPTATPNIQPIPPAGATPTPTPFG